MVSARLLLAMVLIFRDCDGIPGRVDTIRQAFPGEVFHVCPHHLPQPGATPIEIPNGWLPWGAKWRDVPRARREWFAADTLGLAAVQALGIHAPFVWFAESDIHAPPEIWHRVFSSTADSDCDGIFAKLLPREHAFSRPLAHWSLPESAGATHVHLMTLYRLSARAIDTAIYHAESLRDVYAEVKTASMILRTGGTVADLATFCRYSAPRSFGGCTKHHRFTPGVMNHPVKFDIGKQPAD